MSGVKEQHLGDPIILVEVVHKTYPGGVRALQGVSLIVHRREVVVVVGPSGSGKSTFLRCLNGLEAIDRGTIVIDGIPLDDKKEHRLEVRKEVGMVFQSFNLFPHMTVMENINLAQRRVRKRSKKEATAYTLELLNKVGMAEKVDRSQSAQRRPATARSHRQGSGHGSESHAL